MTRTRPSSTNATLTLAAGLAVAIGGAPVRGQGDPLEAPWRAVQPFDALALGSTAWRVTGLRESARLGFSVAATGDLNGDGVGDAVFGDPYAYADSLPGLGRAYVVFGVPGRPPSLGSVDDLDGTNGFTFHGTPDGRPGYAMGAGDFNGDGLADILVGDSAADATGDRSGEAYVIYGREGGFPAALGPDDLDGTTGFRIRGDSGGRGLGFSVCGVGDLNADSVDDLLVAGTGADGLASIYVVFGARAGFGAVLDLPDLGGDDGFRLVQSGDAQGLGASAAAAGDVNGDAVDDALFGAPGSDPGGITRAGAAFVLFGSRDGFPATLTTSDLDGVRGFAMHGAETQDVAGRAVASAGDLNGDGIGDVAVGAPYAGDRGDGIKKQGYAYVVFGRRGGFPPAIALGGLDGVDGFRMEGATSVALAGDALAGGGDLNGDGFDDLAVGAPGTGYSYTCYYCGDYNAADGAAFVIFGRDTGFDASIDLADVSASSVVRFDGPRDSQMGYALSGMTDFNTDGRPDFMLGAIDGFGVAAGPGSGMVIYGRGMVCRADLDGDGELTIFDFLAFQNAFDAGDPIADFDGDGEFTLFDFLLFQTAYDAGCG